MAEITCPVCGHRFAISNEESAKVLSEIRDKAFDESVEKRVKEITDQIYKNKESETKLAVMTVTSDFEKQLQEQKLYYETEMRDRIASVTADLEQKLKEQEAQTNYYRDLKSRMSTKMVGETLEQHCLIEFNKLRATAFRNVYFEKDNDARTGSKGDFIYRECDENGVEVLSIMFEMKNEMDNTEQKHKNEQFFKELDKDRREKNCEYAVLVSMLEADNDFYNTGIADVSYQYDKMYVIRPQFFIPMITVLRNAAYNALTYRQELERIKVQDMDRQMLEQNLEQFRKGFCRNTDLAGKKLSTVLANLDKSIVLLQKMKADLLSAENNLRLADGKLDAITIERLLAK